MSGEGTLSCRPPETADCDLMSSDGDKISCASSLPFAISPALQSLEETISQDGVLKVPLDIDGAALKVFEDWLHERELSDCDESIVVALLLLAMHFQIPSARNSETSYSCTPSSSTRSDSPASTGLERDCIAALARAARNFVFEGKHRDYMRACIRHAALSDRCGRSPYFIMCEEVIVKNFGRVSSPRKQCAPYFCQASGLAGQAVLIRVLCTKGMTINKACWYFQPSML